MTPHDSKHLTADELDASLNESSLPLVASHLATCVTCATMVREDARLVAALAALPAFDPVPGFVDRVMSHIDLHVVAAPVVATGASPRAIAARRRAMVAAAVAGGGLLAGLAWGTAHPGAALHWSSPAFNDVGHTLWVALQTVVANAREQAWFATVRDTFATPAKALAACGVVGIAYAIGLTGLRRLMTEPTTHAAW